MNKFAILALVLVACGGQVEPVIDDASPRRRSLLSRAHDRVRLLVLRARRRSRRVRQHRALVDGGVGLGCCVGVICPQNFGLLHSKKFDSHEVFARHDGGDHEEIEIHRGPGRSSAA
jgi:hypothetical protein